MTVIESDRIMFLTASSEEDPMLHDIAAAAEPQTLLALSTGRSAAYQRRELRLIQADVQMQSEVAFTSSSLSRPILKRILSWELASVSGDKRRRRHGRRRSNSELVKQAPVA